MSDLLISKWVKEKVGNWLRWRTARASTWVND